MAADNEIKVLLTADLAGLQAGMAAATESVTTASEAITAAVEESSVAVQSAQADMAASIAAEAAAFNAAVIAKVDAQVRLNTAFASGITSAAGVAEAEAALDGAMAAGAITTKEYAGFVEQLNAAEAEMAVAEMEAAAAVDVETVAIEANTGAKVMNARVSGELGTMLGEVLSGNFGRLRRSAGALANQSGLLAKAFTPVGMAALAAGAAVFAFADAAIKGSEESAKYNAAILMTGDAAGVTAGAAQEMAQGIGDSTRSYGKANEAMLAMITSGRFTQDQLTNIGTAAVEMSRLTGDSVEKCVQAFEKLQEKPVQAVIALNDKYHFLTQAIFDQIEALQQQGNADEAARVGQEALATALQQRTDDAETHLGTLARAWDSVKESASFAWDAMLGVGREDTTDDKIARLQAQLVAESSATLEHPKALVHFSEKAGDVGWKVNDGIDPTEATAAKSQVAQLNALQATKALADGAAKKKGADDAQVQQYTHDAAALDKWNAGLKDHINLQDQIAAKKAEVEKVHKEDPNSAALKGYTFDASGAVTGGEQWVATVAKLTKEYSNAGSEARKAAQEARKAAAEQMNDLEMVRAGTAANTAERIQADAAVLASATKLYGANSSQQKAALNQMLADSKAYNAAVIKENQQAAQEVAQIAITDAQGAMDLKRQQIESAFALGEISRKQEIAALRAANDAEYQLEMQAFANELKVLDARSKAAEEVEKKIAELQKKYRLESLKSDDDQIKAMQQSWQKALKPIDSAFQQSIQGMTQGTQTFKKGLDNILTSIIASYAQMGISTLITHIANEGAKTTATAAGATARTTIEATSAAASKASDAATGKSQITSAAATGAAKAYQAIVGIPYVGPVLAPIAAGVAFAGIEAFSGMISSARGGWERVPFDGAMTELHKDEMVLPAHIANPMRQMAMKGGQGGGGMVVNLNATDPRGWKDQLRRDPGALANALKLAHRRGHFGSR